MNPYEITNFNNYNSLRYCPALKYFMKELELFEVRVYGTRLTYYIYNVKSLVVGSRVSR